MINLREKLNPARFTAMSPRMAACVGFLIEENFTEPAIVSLVVTSDGFVLAMHEGDIGYNAFIGSESDLKRNWENLLEAADLTGEERDEAFRLFHLKVPA
jgi:hypothetical protein